jgi:hypothetical protein
VVPRKVYIMPKYVTTSEVDITSEVRIIGLHIGSLYKYPMFNGTIRVIMEHKERIYPVGHAYFYRCKTIGVLKSTGWNMFPGYRLLHREHPEANDDSWFIVLKKV